MEAAATASQLRVLTPARRLITTTRNDRIRFALVFRLRNRIDVFYGYLGTQEGAARHVIIAFHERGHALEQIDASAFGGPFTSTVWHETSYSMRRPKLAHVYRQGEGT